eukprot:TRINITY_DN6698_c0_g2_i1.p1 TRINITY_DN6698_c0_g2~~TRINITY_DN6698_c0_g2_i1.p1  ORF type:complete len:538 (-),score=20.66 TRINITY_DN6698_c0_g2_i1:247-1761(-)
MDAEAFLAIACSSSSSSRSNGRQERSPADDCVTASTEVRTSTNASELQVSDNESFTTTAVRSDLCDLLAVFVGFCAQVVIHSVLVPVLCILAMIPLCIDSTPNEVWQSYYWLGTCGVALYFSESFARCGVGLRMPAVVMWLVGLVCATLMVVETIVSRQGPSGISGGAAIMLPLYTPTVFRFIAFIRKGYTVRPLLWFFLFMTWGATPTATSVLLYWGLVALQWKNDILMVAVSVSIWSLVPFLVKAIGCTPVYRGSIKSKFCVPVLWILYCDIAFGTLGLPLFMHGTTASLAYAASIVPVLLLHMARGAGWFSWCFIFRRNVSTPGECRVLRLNSLLEALCAVQGRAAAYTVYFAMMGLQAVFGDGSGSRYSMISGREEIHTMSVQIYRRTSPSRENFLAAGCGLVAIWCIFFMFSWLLPYAWARTIVVTQAVIPDSGDPAPMQEWGGWKLGGGRAQTRQQQYRIFTSFFHEHAGVIVSMYAFQAAITIAAVNLAEYIIRRVT